MPLVVPDGHHERLRRQQRRGHRIAPALQLRGERPDEAAAVGNEGVSHEAQPLGLRTVRMDKVLAVLEALDLAFTVEKANGDRPIRTRLTPWD